MKPLLLILLASCCFSLHAADIVLYKKNATVWLPSQIVAGELQGFLSPNITVRINDSSFNTGTDSNGKFSFTVNLRKSSNTIIVQATNGNTIISSETLQLILPYDPFPVLQPLATVEGNKIKLTYSYIENVAGIQLSHEWKAAPGNPMQLSIENKNDSIAYVNIPDKEGEYYFTLYSRSGALLDSFKTLITKTSNGLQVFNPSADKAAWINSAVIYQVTPYIFTTNRKYIDIEEKLTELVQLGVNTLYLQPVFKTERKGQGYDILDYFSLRDDLGSEADLRSLIQRAKSMNMRVLFDIVPNHTSINHPYALDRIKNKSRSHYYNYYQSAADSTMYAMHYHNHPDGFIYYFWTQLVNLNYNNEEVQRWMIEACKFWIRKFDIDGYRFDAVWGVNARTPGFGKRLQRELKSLKPDLLMIAEDKASPANAYRQGFDAAYDWDNSEQWVSKWSWQYEYDEGHKNTIFNHPSLTERKALLRKAIFSDGDSIGIRLRYLENNDLHRFISNHSRDVTKMAATLLFSLHGLPMLYNGQETGFRLFPYTSGPIYDPARSIRSYDQDLFNFYSKLASVRLSNHALTNGTISEMELNNAPGALAFQRKSDSQDVVVIVNMSSSNSSPALKLYFDDASFTNGMSFTDLITGDTLIAKRQVNGFVVPVDASSTRVLLLNRNNDIPSPGDKALHIVPNPSDGSFTLNYTMEQAGRLNISISDSNGRTLLNTSRTLPSGRSSIQLSVSNKASQTCYIKTNDGQRVRTAAVLLLQD